MSADELQEQYTELRGHPTPWDTKVVFSAVLLCCRIALACLRRLEQQEQRHLARGGG